MVVNEGGNIGQNAKLFDAVGELHTGYAVATFQKDPTALRDIWTGQPRRGLNQAMRALWDRYAAFEIVEASGLYNRTEKIDCVEDLEFCTVSERGTA